jgi:hypothetical protein
MVAHDIPSPEASINTDATPLSNQYRLIRADGTETTLLMRVQQGAEPRFPPIATAPRAAGHYLFPYRP